MKRGIGNIIALFIMALALTAAPAQAATTLTVSTTTDELAANANCSLREAIMNLGNGAATYGECGAWGGAPVTINIPDVGAVGADTFTIAIPGIGDETNATGDLDINADVTITGAGAATTTINGGTLDRVFHVTGAYTVVISGVTITGGSDTGGGIYNGGGTLFVDNSIISGNLVAGGEGGGIYNNGGRVDITNSTISNNEAGGGGGGGVAINGGPVIIANSTISFNLGGPVGGGVLINSGMVTITGSTIEDNSAGWFGAGVYNAGAVTITDSTISDNTAYIGSAGVFNTNLGTATISNSTISGNTALGGSCGGLENNAGTATTSNVTISGNSATGNGGGICNTGGGTLTLTNTTISGNTADSDNGGGGSGGGIYINLSTTSLSNTIVANQTAGADCAISGGTLTSGGYNLDSDNTCGLNQGTDVPSGTANLAALANNGGPTQTRALLAGSAAIDAGTCVNAADQRGYTRPAGATCDIGAYEYYAVVPDTIPNAFNFTAQTGVALSTVATSNTITVSGINSATGISISGGEYAVSSNGGSTWSAWSSTTPNTVSLNDQIKVRLTSSASYSILTTATLTIGGVSDAFDVTTQPATTSYTGATATGTGNATAIISGAGCGFSIMQFVPAVNPPAGVTFPHGLFDFTLSGCSPSGTVTLNITYPSEIPAGTQYWKYGPTPDDAAPHWYVMPAVIAGNTATFDITDGGLGDDDLTANGTIVDQGGPGNELVQVPALSFWGLLLLGLAVAGLAGRRGQGGLRTT